MASATLVAEHGSQPPKDAHEGALGPHDPLDVSIGPRGLLDKVVCLARIEEHTSHLVDQIWGPDLLAGLRSGQRAPSTVGAGAQRVAASSTFDMEGRAAHGARHHTKHALVCRDRPFAMHPARTVMILALHMVVITLDEAFDTWRRAEHALQRRRRCVEHGVAIGLSVSTGPQQVGEVGFALWSAGVDGIKGPACAHVKVPDRLARAPRAAVHGDPQRACVVGLQLEEVIASSERAQLLSSLPDRDASAWGCLGEIEWPGQWLGVPHDGHEMLQRRQDGCPCSRCDGIYIHIEGQGCDTTADVTTDGGGV